MKRQFPQHNPIDPSPIRYSFPRSPRDTRRPETRTIPSGSRENQGITRKKRVRFEGVDEEEPPEASRDDDDTAPKTSEYAFFQRLKELKEGTGRIVGSGSMRGGVVDGSKLSESADSSIGRRTDTAVNKNFRSSPKPVDSSIGRRTNVVGYEYFRSSLATENGTPEKFVSSDLKKAGSIMDGIHSEWEWMILYSNSPTPKGDLGEHVDIFSEKRRKLCRWVAENSYPEFTDLRSQGCDFVSVLLKRLFPETSEDKVLNKGKWETDTKCGSHAEAESDTYFQNFHRKPVRNEMQLEYMPSQDVGSQSFFSYSDLAMNRGQQRTDCKTPLFAESESDTYFRNYVQLEDGASPNVGSLSYLSSCHDLLLDRVQSGTGTKAALLTEPESEIFFRNFYQMPIRTSRELEYRPEYGPVSDVDLLSSFLPCLEFVTKATPVSSTICDSTSDFISEDPGFTSTYFKEIKERCYFDGLSSDTESYAVLQEDINFMSNKRKESPNCLTTELSPYPISASSGGDDQSQNLNGFSLSRLRTQSLISEEPGLTTTSFKEIEECCYFDGLSSEREPYAVLREDVNFMSNE